MKKSFSAFLLVLCASGWSYVYFQPRQDPLVFQDTDAVRAKLETFGLHCNYDNRSGITKWGFLACRLKMSPADVTSVVSGLRSIKRYPANYPDMVWFSPVSQDGYTAEHVEASPNVRTWGNVRVTGDEALLNWIEEALCAE